jgi:histidine triad (HIT) family protein
MASIFTKIVNRNLPAYIVEEDEKHMAFLDIRPLKEGHTLVIPKREVDYILDLSSEEFAALWTFAKSVAMRLEKAVACKRIALVVLGMEVPHAHIHLIPIDKEADIHFDQKPLNLSPSEFEAIAERIKKA